eukprot:jgi/Psemu1/307559/fgenesh1_kg.338_\
MFISVLATRTDVVSNSPISNGSSNKTSWCFAKKFQHSPNDTMQHNTVSCLFVKMDETMIDSDEPFSLSQAQIDWLSRVSMEFAQKLRRLDGWMDG